MSVSSNKYMDRNISLDIGFGRFEDDFHAEPNTMFIERKNEEIEKADRLLKEFNSYEQCEKNKDDKCEHSRCKYSVLIIDSADFGQGSGFYCGRYDE